MRSLTITAPAKVNLFLGVGAVRADGYHAVTTVMHALELADTVRLTPADDLTLSCDADLGIPAEKNLAYRAACEFAAAFDVDVLLDIEVRKAIPSGAGLGGGSSDAAAVLAGLAHWAGLPHDHARLQGVARSLGADCAFLLADGPALMAERGDAVLRLLTPISGSVVVVKPPQSVPTADAYRAFDLAPAPAGDVGAVTQALDSGDAVALASAFSNNMTAASTGLVPAIGEVRSWLAEQGTVTGTLMAGSGSAVFALCADEQAARRIASAAEARGWWAAATALSPTGARVIAEEPAL
jgi:4-diphosphocytidyl-2-C-methyl-D-erythritol kinase